MFQYALKFPVVFVESVLRFENRYIIVELRPIPRVRFIRITLYFFISSASSNTSALSSASLLPSGTRSPCVPCTSLLGNPSHGPLLNPVSGRVVLSQRAFYKIGRERIKGFLSRCANTPLHSCNRISHTIQLGTTRHCSVSTNPLLPPRTALTRSRLKLSTVRTPAGNTQARLLSPPILI